MMRKRSFLATLLMASPLLAPGAAFAQTTDAASPGRTTQGIPKAAVPAPQTDPAMVARPAPQIATPGVVKPPVTDPGIMAPPPQSGTTTVIPPPGSAGGNPAIIPK